MSNKQSRMFIMMPKPEHVLSSDMQLVLANFLLMKLAGQVTVSKEDLKAFARDYAGYTMLYDADTEMFTLTLKSRPEENPAPEID